MKNYIQSKQRGQITVNKFYSTELSVNWCDVCGRQGMMQTVDEVLAGMGRTCTDKGELCGGLTNRVNVLTSTLLVNPYLDRGLGVFV